LERAGWSFEAVDRCGKFRKARLKAQSFGEAGVTFEESCLVKVSQVHKNSNASSFSIQKT
jgi:hypothetical protein